MFVEIRVWETSKITTHGPSAVQPRLDVLELIVGY